jgi:hypothetical protein
VLLAAAILVAAVASVVLSGYWLGLIGLGINAGLVQGGWFLFGIIVVELLLAASITGLMPGVRATIRRLFVHGAMAWLMVVANVLLFTFVLHIY